MRKVPLISGYMFIISYISTMPKKVGKLVRFKQKEQKQASFLAFHNCCQGCLLRGPRYIRTSFILLCALRCYIATGYQESLFVGWKVYSYSTKMYSSSTNKAKMYSYSIFVQHKFYNYRQCTYIVYLSCNQYICCTNMLYE
jgi:hypothetical protein